MGYDRSERVTFFPLANAVMEGEARCVAGLDLHTGSWVRPVVPKYRCVFADGAARFKPNHVHQLVLGSPQPRPPDEDPMGYHTEDRPLVKIDSVRGPVSPADKLQILEKASCSDLAAELQRGHRSLFVVRPDFFFYREDSVFGPRFRFTSTIPGTFHTSGRRWTLPEHLVAVGRAGPKCTCPRWVEFARARWPGLIVNERQLRQRLPGARVYLLVSLSALYDDFHWLIVAGVHVVNEVEIWL